ncbi:hypothetical protein ACJX0J_007323, partial [Zea mays]
KTTDADIENDELESQKDESQDLKKSATTLTRFGDRESNANWNILILQILTRSLEVHVTFDFTRFRRMREKKKLVSLSSYATRKKIIFKAPHFRFPLVAMCYAICCQQTNPSTVAQES